MNAPHPLRVLPRGFPQEAGDLHQNP